MEKVTLAIVFDPATGQVSVSGPIQNRMLSYAMLKLAEKAIDEITRNAKPLKLCRCQRMAWITYG